MNNAINQFPFPEELLGLLTYTAYQVALKAGINKPFLEVELELWNSLRKVMKETIQKKKNCNYSITPSMSS